MKQGFLKLLKNIKLYSSYYFAIASVIGVMWGSFAAYDKWKDSNDLLQTNVNTILNKQVQQTKMDSVLFEQQKEMKEQLIKIQGTTQSLESSYVRYLAKDKTLTKEDFLQYMEGLSFDVKKNSSRSQIPVNPPLMLPEEMTASK